MGAIGLDDALIQARRASGKLAEPETAVLAHLALVLAKT
jgi:hypothetical protein